MTSVSGSGERILAILDLFREDRPEWSPEEMMQTLGYSRPTLYRYLKTLKDAGYLVSLPQAGYTLGPRVTELDFLMRRSDPLIAASQPYLTDIARRFRVSAFIVRWYGRKLLCVASECAAPKPRSAYPRGRPMPLGRGAISRAIVAHLPSRDRSALIDEYLYEFITSGIGASKEAVLAELRRVRRDGVATARGEVTAGLLGVAAPILAQDATPIGALCLSGDEAGFDAATLDTLRHTIRRTSREISSALGQTGPKKIA